MYRHIPRCINIYYKLIQLGRLEFKLNACYQMQQYHLSHLKQTLRSELKCCRGVALIFFDIHVLFFVMLSKPLNYKSLRWYCIILIYVLSRTNHIFSPYFAINKYNACVIYNTLYITYMFASTGESSE